MGLSEPKAAVEKGDNEGNHHQSKQVHQLKVFPNSHHSDFVFTSRTNNENTQGWCWFSCSLRGNSLRNWAVYPYTKIAFPIVCQEFLARGAAEPSIL